VRIVLDTSVLVAAIRSPTGASKVLMDAALSGWVTALLSTSLLLEYEAVLTRFEHLRVSGFTIEEIEELLDSLCREGVEVPLPFKWRPQLRDPDDEMVLELAINGRADAIVTFNRSDFIPAAIQFGIAVLSPGEILDQMEAL
jgi:putative PIN family toxin of toxin-antitoxin system